MSEKDVFDYMFSWFIIVTLLSYLPANGYNYESSRWIELVTDVAITVIGIKLTWDTNLQGDRRDYISRFISLGFVNGIRVKIKLILTYYLLYLILRNIFAKDFLNGARQDFFDITLTTIFQIIFYYRLNRSFRIVSFAKTPMPGNPQPRIRRPAIERELPGLNLNRRANQTLLA
ncbi:MAG TPA: hypothetical protein VFI14_10905 [Chryseosolibacter sp.]|nr:hypothetical protein [Chryseosolibacter sp.]